MAADRDGLVVTDWRSEPPDEAGLWYWRLDDIGPVRLRVVLVDGTFYVRYGRAAYTTWTPLPVGGQWLKVPE